MSFSNLLTADQKKQILESRITGWAQNIYDQEVLKEALLASNPNANTEVPDNLIKELSEAVESAQKALMEIEA